MSTQTELKSINRFPGLVNSGSYIIKFKDDVSKAASLSSDFTARHGLDAAITHGGWDESLFNGFAGGRLFMQITSWSIVDETLRETSET
jgi:hypothetical protein